MIFSFAIYSPPHDTGPAACAFRISEAVLGQGHHIYRLFFFNDGVYNCAVNDDIQLCRSWQHLIETHQLDAIVCVASAEKRGLSPTSSPGPHTLHPAFSIAGVAQLIDANLHSDRLISFGGS